MSGSPGLETLLIDERDAALLAAIDRNSPFAFARDRVYMIAGSPPEWPTLRQRLRKLEGRGLVGAVNALDGKTLGYSCRLRGERQLELWRRRCGEPRWP